MYEVRQLLPKFPVNITIFESKVTHPTCFCVIEALDTAVVGNLNGDLYFFDFDGALRRLIKPSTVDVLNDGVLWLGVSRTDRLLVLSNGGDLFVFDDEFFIRQDAGRFGTVSRIFANQDSLVVVASVSNGLELVFFDLVSKVPATRVYFPFGETIDKVEISDEGNCIVLCCNKVYALERNDPDWKLVAVDIADIFYVPYNRSWILVRKTGTTWMMDSSLETEIVELHFRSGYILTHVIDRYAVLCCRNRNRSILLTDLPTMTVMVVGSLWWEDVDIIGCNQNRTRFLVFVGDLIGMISIDKNKGDEEGKVVRSLNRD